MFGNQNRDSLLKAIANGEELYVPIGGEGLGIESASGGKVARAGVMDFLKAAKRRVRKQNPISPNQADYVNWVLYDRIKFAQAAVIPQLTKLFVIPIGGGGKTKVDTNLEQVSTLPAPQWFNCTGVALYFGPNAAPIDLVNFFDTEYMEFWVSQKVYLEGPVDYFPQAGGLMQETSLGTMAAAATSFVSNTTNGWPSIHNMYDVRLPAGLPLGRDSSGAAVVADGIIGITILQAQTFNVQFKADGGGSTMALTAAVPVTGIGMTVAARLHGILSRGVQ